MLRAVLVFMIALLSFSLAHGQQTASVPVELHRVGDALVLIITPSEPISLAGLRFQIMRNDTPQTPVFLRELFAETSLNFYTFDQPACLALEPLESRTPFPVMCQQMNESRIIRQPVVPADMFWIDFITLSPRPISIVDDNGTTIALCPSSPEPCAINFTFAPPTNAPTPEPIFVGEPADIANREVLVLISEFEVFSEAAGDRVNPQLSWERQFQEVINTVDEIQNARVLAVPGVIRSHDEARVLSEQYQATMVVWGYIDAAAVGSNYTITPRWSDVETGVSETGAEVFTSSLDEMALYVSRDSDVEYIFNFLIGQLLYFEENYEDAVLFLDTAISELTDDHADQMGAAALYFQRGYIASVWENADESAVRLYTTVIALNPEYTVAYNNRGLAYHDLGNYEQALADYERALELDAHYADAYNNRGLVYFRLGSYEQALADYERALELDSENVHAYNNRGLVYGVLGDYEAAIEDFDRTLELSPQFTDAHYYRGLAYSALGDYRGAIEDYNHALELDPENANIFFYRAVAYYSLRNYQQAIADYDRAIQLNPQFANAYWGRADSHYDFGNHELALADYRQYADLMGDNASEFVLDRINELKAQLAP